MNYFQLSRKALIPEGLSDLMTDIAREVLRRQPEEGEMYEFISDYLEALLKTRDSINASQIIVDEAITQTLELSNILQKNEIDFEKALKSSKIIQQTFRNYSRSKESNFENQLSEAQLLCDLVKKCNFTKDEIFNGDCEIKDIFKEFCEKYIYMLNKKEISEDNWITITQYLRDCIKIKSDQKKLNKAAIKIQAAFKGYIFRKRMNSYKTQVTKSQSTTPDSLSLQTSCSSIPLISKDMENAAIKIQAAYRGYRERYTQNNLKKAALKIQSQFRGYKIRKQNFIENKAAISIQTSFRRYRERKRKESIQISHKGNLKTLKDKYYQGSGRKLSVRFDERF